MRVIITGGTGLVGRGLARSLAQDGHEVIVLSRSPERGAGKLPPGVRVEAWDARTAKGWGELAEGAGAVVNLAGENLAGGTFAALLTRRWTAAQRQQILLSRVRAGEAVTQAVDEARMKPAVLIQASAVGYYGDRGDEILDEAAGPGSDFAAGVCRAWEASTQPVEEMGVRRAVVRTAASVLSLESGSFPFMLLPYRLFVGGPLGSGRQWFSWIHHLDEVRGIRFLIENPQASGAFNLCAPEPLTNRAFGRTLAQVLRRPSWLPVPAFALRLVFGAKAEILLGSQRQVPKRLQELGFQWQFPEVEAALRELLGKPAQPQGLRRAA